VYFLRKPLFAIGSDLAFEIGHHEGATVIDGQQWRTDIDLYRPYSDSALSVVISNDLLRW
jgi:hypothetical protein